MFFNLFTNKNFSKLMSSYRIQAIADSLLSVFSIVFLYEKFNLSIFTFLTLFLIDSFLSIFGFIFGAKIMSKIGMRTSIIIGSIMFMINYLGYVIFNFNFTLAFIVFLLSSVVGRGLFWTGYHVSFSLFTDNEKLGEQIGRLKNIIAIIGVIIPILSSFIIEKVGFNILFLLAFLIYIISIFPLLKMDNIKQKYDFGFLETFKNIFSKKYIRNFFIGFSEGGETGVKVIMWPIFMYIFMDNSISSVGVLMSSILLVTLIANSFVGKISDKKSKASLIRLGGIMYGFGWVGKVFSITSTQLFIFSAYQNIINPILKVPYESRFYESINHKGDLVDEYTVMREVSNFIGRFFVIGASILINFLLPIKYNLNIMLLIAGLLSMMMGLLSRDSVKK